LSGRHFLSFLSQFSPFKTISKLGWVGFGSLNVMTQLARKRSFKSEFYKRYLFFQIEQQKWREL